MSLIFFRQKRTNPREGIETLSLAGGRAYDPVRKERIPVRGLKRKGGITGRSVDVYVRKERIPVRGLKLGDAADCLEYINPTSQKRTNPREGIETLLVMGLKSSAWLPDESEKNESP